MKKMTLQTRITLIYAAVFFLQIMIWFFFYRLAGYNDMIGTVIKMIILLTAVVLVLGIGLSIRRLGLQIEKLVEALEVIALAGVVVFIIGGVLKIFGSHLSFFRPHYSLHAAVSSLFLEALGEELLFVGVFYLSICRFFEEKDRWQAVLITALLYGLWFLPGSAAVGLDQHNLGAQFLMNLLTPFLMWLVLGLFYYFSENLWLVVLLHASIIYPLTGLLVNAPVMMILFFIAVGGFLYWSRTRQG
ncbi:MAG: CPBP family intramembrane metalloprotease [Anaerolineales bacterium]|nr:CPBP family intramembrane metalloprotease [Anaerolineales bacterium]